MNLNLLVPELSLLIFAVAIVLINLSAQRRTALVAVSVVGLVVSAAFTVAMWLSGERGLFSNMLAVDNFALFFKLLFLGIAILIVLSAVDYAPRFGRFRGEFFALVLVSTLGMMLMAATTELISIYVSLELTGISLYILVGFLKDSKSGEASLKYLLLGAIASAVLLYGMALIFGFTGKTQLGDIARSIQAMSLQGVLDSPGLILGIVLLVAGFGFKIAAIPFHMWVPDVYEGAPTPVTAYLSVASKAAGFAVILRVFHSAFGLPGWLGVEWGLVFAVLAAIGMTLGNVLAIPQANIKRMLGYSSIAQAGYLLVGLATVGMSPLSDIAGRSGVLFFLSAYALTNMGAFIAIIAISSKIDSDLIEDYAGMGKRAPLISIALTLSLISLIGMPPAAGFMAKFYIFSAAVNHGLLWLVIIAVINSVISAYYYMRVIKVMWLGEPKSAEGVPSSGALRVALFISCLGVLLLGIAPAYAMKLAQLAATMLAL